MSTPLVSVIIPIYNTEKYLSDCLDSVINQSLKNIEIICVNDGSPDNSAAVLKKYSESDKRIHVITQENGGLSKARNAGIREAAGEYICFLDSDDMLVENVLEELYDNAKKENLDILCFDAECIYENEYLKLNEYKNKYYQRARSFGDVKSGQELFCEMIEENAFCDAAWILFINRQWLINNNLQFYPGIIYEDNLFSFQCHMLARRMRHTNKRYVIYRIRENSIMTSKVDFRCLYGRLICYIEILKMAQSINIDLRTQAAVAKFALFVWENLRYVDYALSDEEREKFSVLKPLEKLYLESMGIRVSNVPEINEEIYLEGFKDIFVKEKDIILYGAGKIGRRVLQFLRNNNIDVNIDCFAVTEKDNTQDEVVMGLQVKGIEELAYKSKDAYVVITARRDYQIDMYNRLIELGFTKIAIIDYRLEKIINKSMKKVS